MNRTRLVLTTAVALVAATLVVPSSARADGDPAGTVVIGSGTSAYPQTVQTEALTTQAVVFRDERGLVLTPRNGGAATVLTSTGSLDGAAGSMLLYRDYSDNTQHWFDTSTGSSGVTPQQWKAPSPRGGVLLSQPTPGTVRLSVQNAVTKAVKPLADIPYSGSLSSVSVVSGAAGVVVSWSAGWDPAAGPTYVGYVPWSGGAVTSYDLSKLSADQSRYIFCAAPSATTVACQGFSGSYDLYAVPVGGGAFSVVATSIGFTSVAVTRKKIAWFGDAGTDAGYVVQSVPVTGGPRATGTRPVNDAGSVQSDGSTFAGSIGSTPADAGIYTFADATSTPARVVATGAAPYEARGLAIAPGGRVAWSDNRRTDAPIWQRQLSSTPGGVTAGAESVLVTGATGYGLSLSGARSAYRSAESRGTWSVSGPFLATVSSDDDQVVVSGNRALTQRDGRPAQVIDLVTSTSTDLASRNATQAILWGDRLTYSTSDGAVWRSDLAAGGPPKQVLPASTLTVVNSSLSSWGDWVAAYRLTYQYQNGNSTYSAQTTIVNVAQGTKRVIPDRVDAASAAGYLVGDRTLTSWDGTASVSVDGSDLVATATTMAWLGSDGQVRAAPVPWATADVPRSLGNPLAPASVAAGATWIFDLPTSAPLTTCRVVVSDSSGKAVRSLPCDAGYAGGGDAAVQWNTRTTTGKVVAPGVYSWKVVASNGDGALRLGTGAAGTVKGQVTVTAAG